MMCKKKSCSRGLRMTLNYIPKSFQLDEYRPKKGEDGEIKKTLTKHGKKSTVTSPPSSQKSTSKHNFSVFL